MHSATVPYQLVIFDCDGVLVDSERITNAIFAEMLREIGIPATREFVFEHFVGRSMASCERIVREMLGDDPPADFWARYRERTLAALHRDLVPVDGIEEALDAIALPWCVASSGGHEKMRTTLGITGLLPRFDGRLFSATEVARGKPAPDLFLFAAERCGIEPAACLVVEDAPAGIEGAKAAGMTVCGYAGHFPAERLERAGADIIIRDMRSLPAVVSRGAPPEHSAARSHHR